MPQNHPVNADLTRPPSTRGPRPSGGRRFCAAVWRAVGLAGLVGVLGVGGAGCEMPSGEGRLLGASSEGTQATAVADWDDIEAAMDVAISKLEMAVEARPTRDELRSDQRGAECVEYTLVTIRDEPARVLFCRNKKLGWSDGTGDGPEPITILVRVGRWGDSAREAELLKAIRARLNDLKGVDWAPIRN